nr:class II aldolase/adducin family protein [Leptospiraceae bacterium]
DQDVPFFLIENHGLTVWGKDVKDANKNLEAAEFVMQVFAVRNRLF